MKGMPDRDDENRVLALYTVAARDFMDYLDTLSESETTLESLQVLEQMCSLRRRDSDNELGAMMLPGIKRRIKLLTK